MQGRVGRKGRKNWDNCNSIINKIYFKKSIGKKLKAGSGIALTIEVQRRAVESHEEETPERFISFTRKRAKDSNFPRRS